MICSICNEDIKGLSPKEKVSIYKWIENSPIFTADIESNEYNDFDLQKELSKKFDKTDKQSKSIIKGWEISRGYSKSKGGVIHHKDGHPEVLYQGGNSAEPINNGRCCDECNLKVVIPKRLEAINKYDYAGFGHNGIEIDKTKMSEE